jgi:hypothetical protein
MCSPKTMTTPTMANSAPLASSHGFFLNNQKPAKVRMTELPTNRITSAIKSSVVAFGDGFMYFFKVLIF